MNEEKLIERVKSDLKSIDQEQMFRDSIDETTETIQIGSISFTPSRVLEELDPIAFRCGVSDYMDSLAQDGEYEEIDGEYYQASEVEEIREELES